MLLVGAAMVGLFFALSVYMQAVLGYNALTTGLTQLPLAGALAIVAGVTPAVIGSLGAKRTLVGSLLVLAGGLVWLSFAPADAVFVSQLLGPTVLIGIGMGAAFVTTTQLAVDGVDGGEAGLAGGLINASHADRRGDRARGPRDHREPPDGRARGCRRAGTRGGDGWVLLAVHRRRDHLGRRRGRRGLQQGWAPLIASTIGEGRPRGRPSSHAAAVLRSAARSR